MHLHLCIQLLLFVRLSIVLNQKKYLTVSELNIIDIYFLNVLKHSTKQFIFYDFV